jgi:hypothetical protein
MHLSFGSIASGSDRSCYRRTMSEPIAAAPVVAQLRPRNQLTLPEPVVAALGATPGERFLVSVEGPDSVRLVRIRRSYAGAFQGMWGDSQEAMDGWLRSERETWERRRALYEDHGSDPPK